MRTAEPREGSRLVLLELAPPPLASRRRLCAGAVAYLGWPGGPWPTLNFTSPRYTYKS